MTTRPQVVELIADCLHHPDTRLAFDQIAGWRHQNGVAVTDTEAETIRRSTIGEIQAAIAVWDAEHETYLAFRRVLGED